jgi:hypothetical protein
MNTRLKRQLRDHKVMGHFLCIPSPLTIPYNFNSEQVGINKQAARLKGQNAFSPGSAAIVSV